jgi:Flp pilus assembly protein TadG
MRRLFHSLRDRRGERGAVLVTFALFAPVLVLMMSFVLDVGNVFALQSHLQTQADAGALAAENDFAPCNNTTISNDVARYSGVGAGAFNSQIGSPSTGILELINSTTYPGPDPGTPDDTNTAAPCTSGEVDVKMADTSIPWYFHIFSGAAINAHARLQIGETEAIPYAIPLSFPDPTPTSAAACFVDESSGKILQTVSLTDNGGTWSNATAASVTINGLGITSGTQQGVGVRIALSPNASTSCTDPSATVYDTSGGTVGLLHIEAYTATVGSLTTPVVHSVTLPAGTCTDGYVSDPTASCTVGITAQVDYGQGTKPAGAAVTAAVDGNTYTLTYVSTSGDTETWSATGLAITQANGPNAVSLTIKSDVSNKSRSETINNVQSSYTAGQNSGPITAAGVSQTAGGSDADSFLESATPYKLYVTIKIPTLVSGALETLTPNNVVLCPPLWDNFYFYELVANGCTAPFQLNTTDTSCNFNAPYNCVYQTQIPIIDQLFQEAFSVGLNQRILGSDYPSTCTSPNNWSEYPNIPAGDPRLITMFATPYGSTTFNDGSNPLLTGVPIEDFATFYVTGWNPTGGLSFLFGGPNPCQGHGDDTAPAGDVVGHFINYVNTEGTEVGGVCNPNGIDQCTATLTR